MLELLVVLALSQNPGIIATEGTAVAFGLPARITVSGLPRPEAESVIGLALDELQGLEPLLDPDSSSPGSLGALNAAAGSGPVAVDPRVVALLVRANGFCLWSGGVSGPLGGHLYRLWGLRQAVAAPPGEEALAAARAGVSCGHLGTDPNADTAELAPGSRADLWAFAAGGAVDRAVEILRENGVVSALVEIGGVRRAFGPGPYGDGWPVHPPEVPGLPEALPTIWLRDQALAAATPEDGPLRVGRQSFPPYMDLRKGQPAEGVLAVLASTELAVEAQGLAATMFATGSRDGQMRLGSLSPRPSVLWILGSGSGQPLLVEYRWSELRRPPTFPQP